MQTQAGLPLVAGDGSGLPTDKVHTYNAKWGEMCADGYEKVVFAQVGSTARCSSDDGTYDRTLIVCHIGSYYACQSRTMYLLVGFGPAVWAWLGKVAIPGDGGKTSLLYLQAICLPVSFQGTWVAAIHGFLERPVGSCAEVVAVPTFCMPGQRWLKPSCFLQ
jgi:hypothetical protein